MYLPPHDIETTAGEAYWQSVEGEEREAFLAEMTAAADAEYMLLVVADDREADNGNRSL